jgi:hypothetical protein
MVDGNPQVIGNPAHQAMVPPEDAPLMGDEGLPPLRTWMTLAEEVALLDHSYAYQIYLNHRDDDWEMTLCPSVDPTCGGRAKSQLRCRRGDVQVRQFT